MFRVPISSSRTAVVLALTAWMQVATAAHDVAAYVDDEPIALNVVDAASIEQVRHIQSALHEVSSRALEELIDQHLGIADEPAASRVQQRAALYRTRQVSLALPNAEMLEHPLPPGHIVARVAGEPILASALEQAAALRLYRLRGELYLQRRRNLDRLIEQRLLQHEAEARGSSLRDLEASLARVEPVSDAEVAQFVAEERRAGRSVANPERVRPYLAFQKVYRRREEVLHERRAVTPIRIELRPPAQPRLPVDLRGGIAFGGAEGPVLVVYSNYVCTICRSMHAELDKLLSAARPPRIIAHDFVADATEFEAAALVRCAAREDRAVAMRRYLLQREPPRAGERWLSPSHEASVARIAGTTPATLRACIEAREIREQIERDSAAAVRLGFDKPPAFVANGVPLSGMQSAERLDPARR